MTQDQLVVKLTEYFKDQPFGGIVTRKTMPELIDHCPVCGQRYKIGQFTITRSKVDHLDQFTVSKPLPKRPRCGECGMRLDDDGSCWWCEERMEK
jgi:transposase